ncbi:Enoyl-[acyl-carrier-protein] reductase [NADH] FabI [Candidatus Hydrogenisulfobacillus filiaventi]|uniref:Enoyl-[acyl-carrier-protein] reductase [NADH] n=1 Tax=Candidatus Hydrogenisulfobacillus filiaventi TaxID=2707344 RepID=A0A6F8ZFY0_9FIRM|nr:Enoyl-[acyl-carrier-protein] reductase [NADH] FabI [Candidatus Hydrogenisulfobacillus filiaventi]
MGLLDGRRAVVTGVANKRSIAWGIAKALDREGVDLILTYQLERFRENIEELVPELSRPPAAVLPLDVSDDGSLSAFGDHVQALWNRVDVLVHAIAYARREDLEGRYVDVSRDGFRLALEVSAFSLTALVRALLPLLEQSESASVMTLTYNGSERVMPSYNIMGVAKAALESSVRYLAWDLGASRIRVNAISAGPIRTLASSGVKGLSAFLGTIPERAPLHENITADDVGNAAVFLAGDWSRHVTGQILFVDSGLNIMGT